MGAAGVGDGPDLLEGGEGEAGFCEEGYGGGTADATRGGDVGEGE